jgi:hypothetical protein
VTRNCSAGETKTRNWLSRHCQGTQAWQREKNMNIVFCERIEKFGIQRELNVK